MNDRVSTYPGRVTLTPVAGEANKYDMTMADEPTQEGTPPTKANLLSDATAAKLDGVATPNAAFDLLSASLIKSGAAIKDALGNLITLPSAQLDERMQIATGSFTTPATAGGVTTVTTGFRPKFIYACDKKGAYGSSYLSTLVLMGSDTITGVKIPNTANREHTYATTDTGFTLKSTGSYVDPLTLYFVAFG